MKEFSKAKMIPLKALAAILIVADHLTFHVDFAWLRPFRELGAPIVSIFFFISGYGLVKSFSKNGSSYLHGFFKKRIWKVILPFIIALVICCILKWQLCRLPYSWFVGVIVFLYLGFWAIWQFLPEHFRIVAVWLWSVLAVILPITFGMDRCWWVCNLAFATGATYSAYEGYISKIFLKNWKTTVASIAVCGVLTLLLLYTKNQYCYIFCYIFIPLIAALLVSVCPVDQFNCHPVAFIAGISYEIYLCQGISMDFLHGRFVYVQNDLLYILLVYLMTILLAWGVKSVASIRYK